MTTIKTITKKTFNNKDSYTVELSDGRTGYLSEKDSDPNLQNGEAVEATLEVKKNKQGKDYNLFTLKRVQPSSTAPSQEQAPAKELTLPNLTNFNKAKTVEDMKFEARKYVLKLVVSLVLAGKLELKDVKEYYTDWTSMSDASIDEIKE